MENGVGESTSKTVGFTKYQMKQLLLSNAKAIAINKVPAGGFFIYIIFYGTGLSDLLRLHLSGFPVRMRLHVRILPGTGDLSLIASSLVGIPTSTESFNSLIAAFLYSS